MLVAARLRHIAGMRWGSRKCMDMTRVREMKKAQAEQMETVAAA